ncbi:MAG: mechanosensitive ion channel family protein [Nitrososphaerota archaeon]|jgi:small-conductance mechanosensitive channel|nr:mechanosensitive ion channel family protein [Nitrososphaerota archaeon]
MSIEEKVIDPVLLTSLSRAIQQTLNISATNAEIVVSVLIFSIIGLACWASYIIINKYVISKWYEKTVTEVNQEIAKTVKIVIVIMMWILVAQFALTPLSFLDRYRDNLNSLFSVMQIILAAYAASKIAKISVDKISDRSIQKNGKNNKHTTFILKQVITVIIVIITAIIILNLFGLTGALQAIAASSTIGGIVIAFALQSTLSDLFSALHVYIDRPFELGDFIYVDEHGGTVKSINVLTTRIQLLQGEELVVSNKELAAKYIRNFRKLQKRRIVFHIGVHYDTPSEKLKKIPSMITEIIKNTKNASPQWINFDEFGEYSLKFFISYFVHATDYGSYLEIQQQINIAIKETLEKEGIEMAYLKNVTFIRR